MKNDISKALENYLESFETCTKQNTVLRRELSEAIPICFAKLERYEESLARFRGLLKIKKNYKRKIRAFQNLQQ